MTGRATAQFPAVSSIPLGAGLGGLDRVRAHTLLVADLHGVATVLLSRPEPQSSTVQNTCGHTAPSRHAGVSAGNSRLEAEPIDDANGLDDRVEHHVAPRCSHRNPWPTVLTR